MQQVMSEYGTRNQVVWIYRHYPIEQLHSKAIKEAEASECAAELGGNDKFWAYVDEIFRVTPANNGLDLALLPQIAEQSGLNRTQFEQCLASGRHAKKVSADLEDALKSGGRGTPHSIVIAPNGKKFTIPGAQPYTNVKQLIDQALQER
jgi:protein-disulfide isomerase